MKFEIYLVWDVGDNWFLVRYNGFFFRKDKPNVLYFPYLFYGFAEGAKNN